MATLLEIIQNAANEIGNIAEPSAVINSTDPTVKRMLRMSNREGKALARAADWTVLQRLHSITTVAAQEEYSLPSDYSRLLPDSEWDRSEQRPLIGPLTPAEWQQIKSGAVGSAPAFRRYRIVRSASSTSRTFRVEPTPATSGEILVFEYISSAWCSNADGDTLYQAWNADTDVTIVDEELMTLGLIVRFKRSIGLDFASEADEYEQMLGEMKAQDRPAPVLDMASSASTGLLGLYNLPETGLG